MFDPLDECEMNSWHIRDIKQIGILNMQHIARN